MLLKPWCTAKNLKSTCITYVLFKFFSVFKNLKSSFSEDKMPVHALDVFIENATKMV